MTASPLASPTATLIASLSPTAASSSRPRESASPGAFARELEQAEAQTRPAPQTPAPTPTPAVPAPAQAKPPAARPPDAAARTPAAGASTADKAQARTDASAEPAEPAQVDDDPVSAGGKTTRSGLDLARLRQLRAAAAAADAATSDGKTGPSADSDNGLPEGALKQALDIAPELGTQAGQAASAPSLPVPVTPAPEAERLPLAVPSAWAGQARPGGPDTDLTAAPVSAEDAHADRASSEGPNLGIGALAQPGGLPLQRATERAEKPALAPADSDPKSTGTERAGAQPASELADARLLAAAHAPLAQPAAGPAGEPGASPALPSFAAELLRASPSATAPQSAPPTRAPTELNLSTPVNNPEFVPRLTGELAVLARDGVQEARVQVNPIELGPIAVQITLEGKQAQVHLAVDNAQTRQLLEQSMPSLAAALRENGLTLTGGGVFQQARQNPREADGTAARGLLDVRGEAETDVVSTTAVSRSRHVGVLDTYA